LRQEVKRMKEVEEMKESGFGWRGARMNKGMKR
jgi:hypothetical protein